MIRFLLMALILMIPVGIILYFYIRMIIKFWSRKDNRIVRAIAILIAIAATLPSINLFSFQALIVLYLTLFILVTEAVRLIIKKVIGKSAGKKRILVSIYRSGIIPVLALITALTYGYFNMFNINEKDYDFDTSKIVDGGDYKIAVISDLHYGNTLNSEMLQSYCNKISEEEPDIIALDGDIVDERTTKDEMKQAIKILGSMKSRYGIYYVYGNHDRALYSSNPPFTSDELKCEFESNNINILDDKIVKLNDNLVLAGREDRTQQRSSITDLLNGVGDSSYVILLDHQPVGLKQNAEAGVNLQISGHTHGGQIWPVGLISDILGFGELNYGEKSIGDYHAVVTSGIAGWGYPIRTGSHSEYLIIQVKSR